MKIPKIANAIGYIDNDLVVASCNENKKTNNLWMKWGTLAACFAVVVIIGAAVLPQIFTDPDNANERYKDFTIQAGESTVIWPWEYRTVYEKYVTVNVDGNEYIGRGREVSESYVGKRIGTYVATGFGETDEKIYRESFDVYEISGVSSDELLAVKLEDKYYIYISNDYDPPSTWCEVMEKYSLSEYVELSRFSFEGKGVEDSYHVLKDDDYIWSILSECASAGIADSSGWHENRGDFVSFTVTSEALGVYKNAMYVTENGYVWTNAFGGEFLYNIGKEAAGKIIKYAKKNSTETQFEPYRDTVSGKIVEITKDHILIDDSILCKNPDDGITYKILLSDIRISRYVDLGVVNVGDIVVVSYEDEQNNNIVDSAVSISKGIISGADILIPE